VLSDLRRRVLSRLKWYWLREKLFAAATWVAMRVLPARPVAVVHGWPDSEGNAVEVIRGLVRHYPGTVYWLRNRGSMRHDVTIDAPAGKVVSLPVNSRASFPICWRAEVTFFTHGLKTAVPPPRSRLVVNLWHGDGPKLSATVPRSASTVVVAATELWGREKGRMFRRPARDIAVVGHPRIDSAADRTPAETRRLLGLPETGAPLVLWLPTFRQGFDGERATYDDGAPISATLHEGFTVPDGVQLVVKPHPFDTDDYAGTGARVIGNHDLSVAGVTLVQLMAAADALISDASSAWVDYLTFDRPVGFFLPDLDRYGDVRGFNVPDLFAVLPGPVLRTPADLAGYLADVRDGVVGAPSTHEAAARIGYRADLPVTEHLFAWLDDYQRARGARPLFATPSAAGATAGPLTTEAR
jgi:CDP-glycerol glycerophosphotransferase